MNIVTRLSIVAALSMACGSALLAGQATPPGQLHFTVNSATLLPTLQSAYATLAKADHDYHGHRVAAMKDIADAALVLGKDLTGDGKAAEPQALSDLQIRSVEMSLLGVGRGAPPGPKHDSIVSHINSAIEQLNLALATETDPKADAPPAGGGERKIPNAVGNNSVEIASLTRIYEILRVADHDYKGHRVLAMRAIARAAKILGAQLTGDGRVNEAQAASDAQLHQSQDLLEQVRASFAASDPKAVLADIDDAVKELTTALSIK
jgi:hypothetical protein